MCRGNAIFLIALSVFLLLLDVKHNVFLSSAKYKALLAVSDIKYHNKGVMTRFGDAAKMVSLTGRRELLDEKLRLIALNKELLFRNADSGYYKHESEILRSMMDISSRQGVQTQIMATVEYRKHGKGKKLIVHAGNVASCVLPNMIVVDPSGVIGKVEEVSDGYVVVGVVYDDAFRLPVVVGKNKHKAILAGGKKPRILHVDEDLISTGDEVYTDNEYKESVPGILVGRLFVDEGSRFLKPIASENRPEYVAILMRQVVACGNY